MQFKALSNIQTPSTMLTNILSYLKPSDYEDHSIVLLLKIIVITIILPLAKLFPVIITVSGLSTGRLESVKSLILMSIVDIITIIIILKTKDKTKLTVLSLMTHLILIFGIGYLYYRDSLNTEDEGTLLNSIIFIAIHGFISYMPFVAELIMITRFIAGF